MFCPNCGYVITKRQQKCPKCSHALPEESGEWSSESSGIDKFPVKMEEEDALPPKKTSFVGGDESHRESRPARSRRKKIPEPTPPPIMREEIPPEASDEQSGPGPLFKASRPVEQSPPKISVYENGKYEEKKSKPESHRDTVEKRFTTPSPYTTDNATFSSELSTDWIDRYSRVHVHPLPQRAGLGVRFWAGTLDWLILFAALAVALLIGRFLLPFLNDMQYKPSELFKILFLPVGGFWFVLSVLYLTIFTVTTGQTPGAGIMDIKVVDAAFLTRSPSIAKAFIRAMAYIGGVALLGAGCWFALFNPERNTWHDKVSGTKVLPVLKL